MLARMGSRKLSALIAFGLLLLGLALWLRTRSTPPAVGAAASPSASELALQPVAPTSEPPPEPAGARSAAPGNAAPPHRLTPQHQQLRERVVRSLLEREQQKRAAAAPGHAPSAASTAQGDAVGTMVDKTGALPEEVLYVLNHELMPMVDQCLDQAHERAPQLKGMLALEVRFAGAEDLGSIIETVEPAPINDLGDEELIDCVRQSAFTLALPVRSSDLRAEGTMTIPYGIDPKQWRPKNVPAQTPPTTEPAPTQPAP